MEYIIEFILELVFESSVEISKSKKFLNILDIL